MICEKCGSPLMPGDMFCGECGNMISFSEDAGATYERICMTCGSPIEPGDMFCGECGAPYMEPEPIAPAVEEGEPRFCSECGRRLDPGEDVCHICALLNEYIDTEVPEELPSTPIPPLSPEISYEPEMMDSSGLKSTMKEPKPHKENEMELKRAASKFFKKPGEI